MSDRIVAYYIGGIFRVMQQSVPGRHRPYEFVERTGAVTMLPTIMEHPGGPHVLTVHNQRYYYGNSVGLPAGNADGGFSHPEPPITTALRELREETGYGILPEADCISAFRLRELSNTINYPRFFVVLRGVRYIGGEQPTSHEQVTCQPTPLEEYIDPLFNLDRGETYPEVNAAFARAERKLGRDAVLQWLLKPDAELSAAIASSFNPWMIAI